ncbi:MAG: hypothetical protein LBN21_12875 [Treponema sp.]|jgi:hypothetical protein|nr:hypothetical protein [Treponema sp.]
MTWHPVYDDMREEFSFGFLKRKEFKKYLTPDFYTAFAIWRQCCRRGLPSGKGWADEPEAILELLDLFDDTRDMLDRLKAAQKTTGEEPGRVHTNNR